jgi:hypothetical protein
MAIAVEAPVNANVYTVSPMGMIVFAIITAFVYYMLRSVTSNKYVVLAIGVALTLFTTGTLQELGLGLLALGVARLMEQDINIIASSS